MLPDSFVNRLAYFFVENNSWSFVKNIIRGTQTNASFSHHLQQQWMVTESLTLLNTEESKPYSAWEWVKHYRTELFL